MGEGYELSGGRCLAYSLNAFSPAEAHLGLRCSIAMLRFHATGSWPAFTVRSQKRLSEQLECRCLKAPTPFRREIYGLTSGGNMMQ